MKKKILIIEDFENSRFVIEFTLKQIGFEVYNAINGQDALKYLDGREINLIITDLNMPVMDGIQFTKEARKMDEYKSIPILMLTTEKDATKKQLAYAGDVTAIIQKPFERETFIKAVQRAVK